MRHLRKPRPLGRGVVTSYAEIPVDVVKAAVIDSMHAAGEFIGRDFDAYHAWYLGQGRIPDHSAEDRWPCMVWDDAGEPFEDGWHRLHCYVRRGDATIPVLYPADAQYVERLEEYETRLAAGATAAP